MSFACDDYTFPKVVSVVLSVTTNEPWQIIHVFNKQMVVFHNEFTLCYFYVVVAILHVFVRYSTV